MLIAHIDEGYAVVWGTNNAPSEQTSMISLVFQLKHFNNLTINVSGRWEIRTYRFRYACMKITICLDVTAHS